MPDEAQPPTITVGFSVQNDGEFIGIQWDMPLTSTVVGVPLSTAEELVKHFPEQLAATIKAAKEQLAAAKKQRPNPLVVASADTLNVLKGNK